MKKIAVLVSGGGTNLEALIKEEKKNRLGGGKICIVISSNPNAYAITRAKHASIPYKVIDKNSIPNRDEFDKAILNELNKYSPDLIVLAGFMQVLGKNIINRYNYKIINVHPSLIPSFCGQGYYGIHVHEVAIEKGVKLSGATVHFVNDKADEGAIIIQKAIKIKEGDTPIDLQKRIMRNAEQVILPKAVAYFCEGKIRIKNNKAYIKEN